MKRPPERWTAAPPQSWTTRPNTTAIMSTTWIHPVTSHRPPTSPVARASCLRPCMCSPGKYGTTSQVHGQVPGHLNLHGKKKGSTLVSTRETNLWNVYFLNFKPLMVMFKVHCLFFQGTLWWCYGLHFTSGSCVQYWWSQQGFLWIMRIFLYFVLIMRIFLYFPLIMRIF